MVSKGQPETRDMSALFNNLSDIQERLRRFDVIDVNYKTKFKKAHKVFG